MILREESVPNPKFHKDTLNRRGKSLANADAGIIRSLDDNYRTTTTNQRQSCGCTRRPATEYRNIDVKGSVPFQRILRPS